MQHFPGFKHLIVKRSSMKAKLHILYVLMLFVSLVSCNSNVNVEASAKPSDTITIGVNDGFLHKDPDFTLRVDSILNDSRCPMVRNVFGPATLKCG